MASPGVWGPEAGYDRDVMDRKLAWIGLNAIPSLTPGRLGRLLERLGGPEEVWGASQAELEAVLGEVGEKVARERAQADPEKELSLARKLGARILTWEEEGYPRALREIPDPPPVLYVLGELGEKDELAIAIVGTRRCTSYGRVVAETLARGLAAVGVTVVSGLAPGIDTAAHKGALSAGRTIAVLGTGLGRPYPAGSERLIQRISEKGAAISEFPLKHGGTQWTFPRRNRIIAGLALGVVVVEAPARSGALITVDHALAQGKEVLAVPGPITSHASAGTNRLIQEGAKLVTCVEDILEEFSMPSLLPPEGKAQGQRDLDPEAKAVYDLVGLEPLGISELVERTGIPHPRLSQILVELELCGLVREVAGRRYMRAR